MTITSQNEKDTGMLFIRILFECLCRTSNKSTQRRILQLLFKKLLEFSLRYSTSRISNIFIKGESYLNGLPSSNADPYQVYIGEYGNEIAEAIRRIQASTMGHFEFPYGLSDSELDDILLAKLLSTESGNGSSSYNDNNATHSGTLFSNTVDETNFNYHDYKENVYVKENNVCDWFNESDGPTDYFAESLDACCPAEPPEDSLGDCVLPSPSAIHGDLDLSELFFTVNEEDNFNEDFIPLSNVAPSEDLVPEELFIMDEASELEIKEEVEISSNSNIYETINATSHEAAPLIDESATSLSSYSLENDYSTEQISSSRRKQKLPPLISDVKSEHSLESIETPVHTIKWEPTDPSLEENEELLNSSVVSEPEDDDEAYDSISMGSSNPSSSSKNKSHLPYDYKAPHRAPGLGEARSRRLLRDNNITIDLNTLLKVSRQELIHLYAAESLTRSQIAVCTQIRKKAAQRRASYRLRNRISNQDQSKEVKLHEARQKLVHLRQVLVDKRLERNDASDDLFRVKRKLISQFRDWNHEPLIYPQWSVGICAEENCLILKRPVGHEEEEEVRLGLARLELRSTKETSSRLSSACSSEVASPYYGDDRSTSLESIVEC